jgi:voltage-gated potassium channel
MRSVPLLSHPFLRRLAWYGRRIRQQLNPGVVGRVLVALFVVVAIAALLEMVLEKPISIDSYAASFFWAITSLLSSGDPGFASGAAGGLIYIFLVVVGVLMLGLVTGAIIAVIIDFLLKEGQGLGASGFRNHIVVCGWNATAREAIDELRSDDYKRRLVLIHDTERNPAEGQAYYVRGDPTSTEDLLRADITDAEAALIFPASASNEADMRSILTVMAIESVAPHVRTVAEVNNPRHVEHFRRAHVDEVLVTPRLASHLLARAALYPGLSDLVTDMVSGGEGSELYRVAIPNDYAGLAIDEASRRLRDEHHATLLAVNRGGQTFMNPASDFVVETGDEALVVATKLGKLAAVRAAELKRAAQSRPADLAAPAEG